MARKHKSKYALMHSMGLCKYDTPPARTQPPPPPTVAIGPNGYSFGLTDVPTEGAINVGGIDLAKRLDAVDARADTQVALQEKGFAANLGFAIFQGGMQIWGAILQNIMATKQWALQERAMTLQEGIVAHKITLENTVAENQYKLADKKLTNETDLATIEKNRQVAIAQIQADAKVEIAGKKAAASAFFPPYNYGSPLAVG